MKGEQSKADTENINNLIKLAPLIPEGSKLIFFTPYRAGVNEENRFDPSGIKTDKQLL